MKKYYTYAYLREDKTPYYIGKGCRQRAYRNEYRKGCSTPSDPSRILILKRFDCEFDAYKHEIYMIAVLGRKDLGTGILRNLTDGGEGVTGGGWELTSDTKERMSAHQKGKPKSAEHRRKISEGSKGKTHLPQTRAKISASKKGKPWTQARRDAQSKKN